MEGRVLIVEDEEAIAAFVQTALERDGFAAKSVGDGPGALQALDSFRPDLILLDLGLPGMDGLQVCQAIRSRKHYIPIIMLTARTDDVDKIVGLEVGADDYVTKPFNARELVARVRALLRLVHRSAGRRPEAAVRFGVVEIDLDGRQVTKDGRNPGRVYGRDTLLEQIWGYDFAGDSRTVDVHMQRLRRKLEENPHTPRYLLSVHSIGYKFAAD
jgi:DNA-binding response OmpR family regulator